MFQLADKGINLKIGEYQKIYIKNCYLVGCIFFLASFDASVVGPLSKIDWRRRKIVMS